MITKDSPEFKLFGELFTIFKDYEDKLDPEGIKTSDNPTLNELAEKIIEVGERYAKLGIKEEATCIAMGVYRALYMRASKKGGAKSCS